MDKFLVKIEGISCFPDLLPQKIYLAKKFKNLKIGDFLVFKYKNKILVKKLKKIEKKFLILEDNFKNNYKIRKTKNFLKIIKEI
jgi:hypothetical protein